MKAMIAAVLVLGLAVGGVVLVHELRRAPTRPNGSAGSRPKPPTPIDRLQSGVTLDWSTDYGSEAKARLRAEEILRREELRQNPRARRN